MPPLLSVRRVSRSFGGLQAVRSVSFELAAGEILGIIGPNGAGKSTLFDLIAGRTAPDDGDVVFEGRSIVRRPPEAVARAGLVKTFQTSRPFGSMSFAENVMVGALAAGVSLAQARMLAHEKLAVVGLGARADASAAWASTGQRKRLEIARALAAGPRLLLLDEPFGGVDLPSVDSLVTLLHTLRASGLSLLVIEHNLDAMHRLADRVIAMHLGEAIAEGSPQAVTSDPRVVDAYLGTSGAGDA